MNKRTRTGWILIGILLLTIVISGCLQEKQAKLAIVSAKLENSKIIAGNGTMLAIKVKNKAAKHIAADVDVTVSPQSPQIIATPEKREIDKLGTGEERILSFEISAQHDALPGRYALDIFVSGGGARNATERTYLKIVE